MRAEDEGLTHDVLKLQIDEGDVVVLRTDRPVSMESCRRLQEMVTAVLHKAGKSAPVMVLTEGIDIQVLKTSQLPNSLAVKAAEIEQAVRDTEASIARGARSTDHRFQL